MADETRTEAAAEKDKPAKKRGAGSFRQRGEHSYELRYRGKRKTVQAPNETMAERSLAAFMTEVDKNKFRPPVKLTIQQFIEQRWLRDHVEANLALPTQSLYKLYTANRIIPALGHIKLDKVTPENLLDFYANLKEPEMRADGDKKGALSPATIKKYHNILSSMFSCAVKWKIIEDNPCKHVQAPKVPKSKPFSLDEKESDRLVECLAKEPLKYRVITAIAILTGTRRGEILGLSWPTLDMEKLYMTVEQTCGHIKGGAFISEGTKTDSSERILSFPKELVPLLKYYKEMQDKQRDKCGDKWVEEIEVGGKMAPNNLVFTQWNGKPMHPNSIDTWFSKFREDNRFPEQLTFHGLRHTNITLLLDNGVALDAVSKNAGHAKRSTTVDIYYGSLPNRDVSDKMGSLLGGQIPNLLNGPVNPRRKKIAN
jgi:integrase